ncbi:MAG: hypothetical protein J6P28_01990 [Treponema sp.]|nr:hypothetical protein [Treponema sp.]
MMNVIALQKDNELFICNYARTFIENFNRENLGKGISLFPCFPLWAFAEDAFAGDVFAGDTLTGDTIADSSLCGKKFDQIFKSRSVKNAFIGQPSFKKEFFFPLSISTHSLSTGSSLENESTTLEFKITFAKVQPDSAKDFALPKEIPGSEKFPLRIKSFRTGNAVMENNAWSLFDEKWIRSTEC